jgi:hypothetical protein
MPTALRRLDGLHPGAVPWAWGVNGAASVLAAVLGIAIALVAGFTVTTLVALACYLLALLDVLTGRWPGTPPAAASTATADRGARSAR